MSCRPSKPLAVKYSPAPISSKLPRPSPKPTAGEVKKYYAEHPELFAQRRVFVLEEIVVPPTEGLATGLKEQAAKARSMQDFVAWLKSQNAKFTENRGARAVEQILLDRLPQLQAMKEGEIRLIEGGGRLNVFRLAAVQAAPVDEPTASHPAHPAVPLQSAAGLGKWRSTRRRARSNT